MNPGKYTIKQLFSNRSLYQLVIPEIQRDYVWGKKQVNLLLEDLLDALNKYKSLDIPSLSSSSGSDEQLHEAFKEYYKKQRGAYNIGFIYAYHDADYQGRYFLIDGQQRLTTLYLLLLILTVNNEKKELLESLLFTKDQEQTKLAYKVRESSQRFLLQFVRLLLKEGAVLDIEEVQKKYWFHTDYKADTTIQSLLANYKNITDFLKKEKLDANELTSYVLDHVEFWYFDTQISAQGEELYLFMNSRGKDLAGNENMKALLLAQCDNKEVKANWGRKWEDWQNFFWKHRDGNSNADRGFNEFLRWVQIVATILKRDDKENEQEEIFDITLKETLRGNRELDVQFLQLTGEEGIESYFLALKALVECYQANEDSMTSQYQNTHITLDALKLWLSSTPLDKRAQLLNQSDLFKLLPLIYFCQLQQKNGSEILPIQVYRLARYLHNIARIDTVSKGIGRSIILAIRLVKTIVEKGNGDIAQAINLETKERSKTLLPEEELIKFRTYLNPENTREEVEHVFWQLEDHEANRGEIRHLFRFKTHSPQVIHTEKSLRLANAFLHFMKLDNSERKSLLLPLRHQIWTWTSPHYYQNHHFSDWHYIVRLHFFRGVLLLYHRFDYNFSKLYKSFTTSFFKRKTTLAQIKKTKKVQEQITILDMILRHEKKGTIWQYGDYIAYRSEEDELVGIHLFEETHNYYNTNRYIGAGNRGISWKMLEGIDSEKVLKELLHKNTHSPA